MQIRRGQTQVFCLAAHTMQATDRRQNDGAKSAVQSGLFTLQSRAGNGSTHGTSLQLRKAGMGASQKLDRKSCASSWQTGSRVGMVAAGAGQLAQAYKTDQGGGHHDVHRMELMKREELAHL